MIKNIFRLFLYLITFVAFGAIAVMLVYKVAGMNGSREVPMVVGQSVSEAAELLNKRSLVMSIDRHEYHDEILEGHVIFQNVHAGSEVKKGTEVKVVVSKGLELFSMPSFEGQLLKNAKLTLTNLRIEIKKVTWVHSDSIERGKIIAQRPLPGNIESNEINFLVSLGPYEVSYRCPSFVNMTVDDARLLAGELGIKLIEKDRGSRVIFQKPEAGTVIRKGDSVEVKLGRGWGMWF
jgi:serine/threonine-protein kinase